jgi:hypothetical protein
MQSTVSINYICSLDLSQARQCGLNLPASHTPDADVIKLLQAPRSCQFSGARALCSLPSRCSLRTPLFTAWPRAFFERDTRSVTDVLAATNEISSTHQQFKVLSDDPVVLSLTAD